MENRTMNSAQIDRLAKRIVDLSTSAKPFSKEIPAGCKGLDMRRLSDVAPNTVEGEYLKIKAPNGYSIVITHYAVFSDVKFATDVEFIPKLHGVREFEYHGTPDPTNPYKTPYRISLGVGSDLSDNCLIEAPLVITEGKELIWYVSNLNANAQSVGVRVKGYLRDNSKQQSIRNG